MSENEYDWLARHLGHDITVHKEFYRMHESAIELTEISRILLAVDQGEAQKYVGKHINEINIEDLPALDDDTNMENENVEEEKESDCDEVEELPNEGERNVDSLKKKKNKKPPKETKSIHVSWTCEEKKAVLKFFQVNIKKGIVHGKVDCERCIKEYEELSNRDWKKIKFCVKNEIQKIRKTRK
ncbi:uncharacterized protein LOC108913763 [Anoplophora glabripennis]|uniref:uncharacterized protein LOC108913763 n=1 Tax=Anoplophora glabripennis TaxID=217634 RepID=UPI0008739349|nr:uncharacterized protein LOC108913763 [Anoplophora glabripennis]